MSKSELERNPMIRLIASLVASLVLLASANLAAAQQSDGKIPRIGYLSYYPDERHKLFAAFQQGLKDLGYVEGKNIVIEERHAEGKRHRVPALIAELLRLNPDIIVTGALGANAAKKATSTIPIVMTFSSNPVQQGLVASLARPGGNVTGLSDFHGDLIAKRVELLKEVVPSALSVAVLFNPASGGSRSNLEAVQAAAPALGVTVLPLAIKEADDFDRAFATIRKERPGVLFQSVGLGRHRRRIVELAAKNQLPVNIECSCQR
jgi:putative ABC transport system substrate-binding protein